MTRFQGDYNQLWKDKVIQEFMYHVTGYRCEHCGMAFVHGSTKAATARNKDGKPVILTIHHLSGDKADMSFNNLLSCCQRCHLKIQGLWRPGGVVTAQLLKDCAVIVNGVPFWMHLRQLPYTRVNQLSFLEVMR